MRLWKGTLTLKADRGKEGATVDARVISSTSAVLEIREQIDGAEWKAGDVDAIHPASMLRALAATGPEVG